MWHNSSGRTPKSCSSLFDLKEVVQRQQQQQQLGGSSHTYCGAQAGRQGPPTRRAQALVEDDGFLKEPVGECPGLWRSAGPGSPPPGVVGGGGARAPPAVPGREPLVAGGLSWGQGSCLSLRGRRNRHQVQRGLCVEGDLGGHGTGSGARASPWPGDLRWGSWHGTGQGSPLSSSGRASRHCAST